MVLKFAKPPPSAIIPPAQFAVLLQLPFALRIQVPSGSTNGAGNFFIWPVFGVGGGEVWGVAEGETVAEGDGFAVADGDGLGVAEGVGAGFGAVRTVVA